MFAAKIMRSERRIPGGAPSGHRKSVFPDAPTPVARSARPGRTRAAETGFPDPKKTIARAFAGNAIVLATRASFDATAKHLHVVNSGNRIFGRV
jgi:hypothetical protein